MGKNKWYNEMEGGANPILRGTAVNAGDRTQKTSSLPGVFIGSQNAHRTLNCVWKGQSKRLWRKWLSLKFQGKQVSGFARNRSVLMKMTFLFSSAFFIFRNNDSSTAVPSAEISPIEWNKETQLGVGTVTKKPPQKKVQKPPKSEAAPVSAQQLRGDQTSKYIQKYCGIARDEMKLFGVPASISLAQGLIESRAGTSKLAVNNQNHFGMKCFSRNCGKGHCSNFTDDTHKDFFLKFSNPSQSWRAHSKLISSGRYAKLKKYGRDYRRWAVGLKSVGYATDKTYAQKLIGIIERYKLDQYDK